MPGCTLPLLITVGPSHATMSPDRAGHGDAFEMRCLEPGELTAATLRDARLILVDAQCDDPIAAIAVAVQLAPRVPTYLLCDDIYLAAVDAALAAGARGTIIRDTEADLIRSAMSFEPAIDVWRQQNAAAVVGDAVELRDALTIVESVADTDSTVMIGGESGTGKELIARAIHDASRRRSGPFIAVNAAAIPETLVETELFGHIKGAFTGACSAREGKLVAASGGTLFLDEIGDMPLVMQAKLLRVLQERQVTPLGSDRAVPVDVRVVVATHRNLAAMVEEGTFRADLYYRLTVVTIDLPALRDRRVDVIPLAIHFIRTINRDAGRGVTGIDASGVRALLGHDWGGNVRELANAIERAVVIRRTGRLRAVDLKLRSRAPLATPPRGIPAVSHRDEPSHDLNLKLALDSVERQFIELALDRAGGNRSEAAALLGLNRTTLVEKLRKRV